MTNPKKVIIELHLVAKRPKPAAARRKPTAKRRVKRPGHVGLVLNPRVKKVHTKRGWAMNVAIIIAVMLGAFAVVHFANAEPRRGSFQDLFRPAQATVHVTRHVRSHQYAQRRVTKPAVIHRRTTTKVAQHHMVKKKHVAARPSTKKHVAYQPSPLKSAGDFAGGVVSGGSQLVSLMRQQLGTNPTGWSRQWCAHYLDSTLRRSGHRGGGNLARGYASYGSPTHARVGAIAVMPHHVGVVTAVGPGYVKVIAGNHSGRSGHRTVGEGTYSMARVIAFRSP